MDTTGRSGAWPAVGPAGGGLWIASSTTSRVADRPRPRWWSWLRGS